MSNIPTITITWFTNSAKRLLRMIMTLPMITNTIMETGISVVVKMDGELE